MAGDFVGDTVGFMDGDLVGVIVGFVVGTSEIRKYSKTYMMCISRLLILNICLNV